VADSPTVALFCGSRDWTLRRPIQLDIEWLPDTAVVLEGGARGADRIAREEAFHRGLHVATVEALWDRYGKSAGYRRNAAMVRMATIVYAYTLGTPGTNHTIALAQQAGIPVHVRTPEGIHA
jgi:hypothetical protein